MSLRAAGDGVWPALREPLPSMEPEVRRKEGHERSVGNTSRRERATGRCRARKTLCPHPPRRAGYFQAILRNTTSDSSDIHLPHSLLAHNTHKVVAIIISKIQHLIGLQLSKSVSYATCHWLSRWWQTDRIDQCQQAAHSPAHPQAHPQAPFTTAETQKSVSFH